MKPNKKIVNLLKKKKLKIAFAESCTGGLLSKSITSVSGSSKVFNLGLVAYSNESKIKVLKISRKIIKKYGAVSEQVCKAMAKNVSKIGNTNMSVYVTGIAGPSGGTRKKPVGLVYVGRVEKLYFSEEGLEKFDNQLSGVLTKIFQNEDVEIYEVKEQF